ncbi:hypothetical protein VNO77_02230 [Canavalia gladiata]|uniref:Secreted protein n=1 Tax=Canavalia gladiata TaxID=3824 RepID=A0AAN9MXV8_CANGL
MFPFYSPLLCVIVGLGAVVRPNTIGSDVFTKSSEAVQANGWCGGSGRWGKSIPSSATMVYLLQGFREEMAEVSLRDLHPCQR